MDDTNVYWCEITLEEGGVVRAAPKTGTGPIRTLGSWTDFQHFRSLVVDQSHVYWLRPEGAGVLVRVDKDGTNPVNLSLPPGPDGGRLDIGPLHDAGDAVIVGEHGCGHVVRIPKDGNAPALWNVSSIAPGGGGTGLETDGAFVYCSSLGYVHRLDTRTGQATIVVSDLSRSGELLRVGRRLFVLNNRPAANTGENLAVIDLDAPTTRDLGPSLGQALRPMHDERRGTLHWLTGLTHLAGELVVYNLDGTGPPQLVFENQDVWGSSAADEEYIYWLSDRAVTRLKKWP